MPTRKKRALPQIDSVFEREYKGKVYKLKVVKSSDGVAYELNGRTFKTPTAAAKSLVKSEINGWGFWRMDK